MTAYDDTIWTRWLLVGVAGLAVLLGALAGLQPKLAIAAIFGIGFAAYTFVNLTGGVCVFTVVWYFSEVLSGIPAAKAMGLVLVGSWLALITVGRLRGQKVFDDNRFLYLIGVFILWAGATLLWAENSGPVLTAVTRYVPNALLFPILYAAIRERDDALKVIGAMIVGALLAAAFGVLDSGFGEDPGRLSGALGNANATAASMVVTLALIVGLGIAVGEQRSTLRGLIFLAVPLPIVFLLMTASRGGLVGLGFALFAAVVLGGRRRKAMIFGIVMVLIGAVVYFGALAPAADRERVTHPEGGTGRSDIWKVGWRLVEAHPINGVGAGNFVTSTRHYLLQPGLIERDDFILDTPKVAHNTYLQILAELGIIGFVIFAGIVLWSFVFAGRAIRAFTAAGDIGMSVMAKAVLIGLVGYLAGAFFDAREYASDLWILMAIAPALLGVAKRELERREDQTEIEADAEADGDGGEPLNPFVGGPPSGFRSLPV